MRSEIREYRYVHGLDTIIPGIAELKFMMRAEDVTEVVPFTLTRPQRLRILERR